MIDPVSFLILIVLSVGFSQIIRPYDRSARLFWLTAPGALLLFIAHPNALWFAIGSLVTSSAIYFVGRRLASKRARARLPYTILLLLFVPDLLGLREGTASILWLGSAFFVVRQMMTVAQATKRDIPAATFVPSIVLATFFFAALPSGPVFNGLKAWDELGAAKPPVNRDGLYRLFEGFIFLFALSGIANEALEAVSDYGSGSVSALVGALVLRPVTAFVFLFTTFYGYSRMAEGTALLFGFSVPQNFDRPHMARDLGDYWKRWHRSMAEFVMQYIYLPLLVTTKQTKVALVGAFVFMGLWHNMSTAFLIWGVGHGIGLGVVLPWAQRREIAPRVIRFASLSWVVAMSNVAHGVWFA
jgi:D-alanyl-lipoteichoic acid acyltransferase DltB (MBOAT superfamily)